MECDNERWVADNPGSTIEWARTMWWCECTVCDVPLGQANG